MITDGPDRRPASRRRFLGAVAAGTVALAGCTGSSDPGTSGSGEQRETLSEPPEWPPVLGDPEAAVTLEVFEDFNCPHCQEYSTEQFPEVKSEYLDPGSIRYEHRDLPFIHATSWQAASAVREVYRLYGGDVFWEYKSKLMESGSQIRNNAPGIFGEIAAQLNLDSEAVREAAANRAHDERVQADRSRAVEYGVEATPGFVVDGSVMSGLADARSTIDSKLSE
ncbi:thioredoxin domain-containing protein [Halovenus sp. WSH3]|uniref:Thioredoxin domain-containing protein n=1 Tax=Halovenus carboxidivorans TaxID=2692199 RepID=A0A6B0T319_9EURY|nr:thioredoxin domain-containing protein [Halovenus carboxidivorans]MXR52678.1 thioredoxin domain-containing protein [Halovenus carboxidivorans]